MLKKTMLHRPVPRNIHMSRLAMVISDALVAAMNKTMTAAVTKERPKAIWTGENPSIASWREKIPMTPQQTPAAIIKNGAVLPSSRIVIVHPFFSLCYAFHSKRLSSHCQYAAISAPLSPRAYGMVYYMYMHDV